MNICRRIFVLAFPMFLLVSVLHAQLARQWVGRFSGDMKGGSNAATAMAIDDSGNVIVVGWATYKQTGADFVTIKYSPDGEKLWSRTYHGVIGKKEDKAKAVVVDTANNIYVTGWSDAGSGFDFVTIKYFPNGDTAWARRYDGPGHGEDKPVAIAVNDSMNVYVTGWSTGIGTGFDFATLKYDKNGNLLWEQRYDGPKSSTDLPAAMTLRGFTDLYVTGASIDTTNDYTVIKYNAATGYQRWVSRYKGPGDDLPRSIALRGAPNVLVTGSSQSVSGDYDIVTVEFDSSGVLQWVSRYDGPAHSNDQGAVLALSGTTSSARIFVAGTSVGIGSFNDFITLRLNADGSENWEARFNGSANDNDAAVAMVGTGNPVVLGATTSTGVGYDYGIVQYTVGGNQQFSETFNDGFYNSDDIPSAIASPGGSTFVTGTCSEGKGSEIVTIDYADPLHLKYRTFTQDSLLAKGVNLNLNGAVPNNGNVRDTGFARAYPKIKTGFPGAPGGLVLGNPRPDSATHFGWIRFTKGANIIKFLPQVQNSRGFDLYGGKLFVGEKKDPTLVKFNDHIAGELLALKINIGASDAEITPPTFGDLTYQLNDTVNGIPLNGMSMRGLAALTDNFLTYWQRYPAVAWAILDSALDRSNRAFVGPLKAISSKPLAVTGAVSIDSVTLLSPSATPVVNPLAFAPGSLDVAPEQYTLYQNYPNPFNPVTTIEFSLPQSSVITLKVYDLLGREIGTLLDEQPMDQGRQEINFNAERLASGIYFYRLVVDHGRYSDVRKMVVVK
jgi:hypothetical protein